MSQQSVIASLRLVEWLAAKVGGVKMRNDYRARTAAVCFGVAQEHHISMVTLCSLRQPLYSSVFALARPLFEGWLRGMWLAHFATDDQLNRYHEGRVPDVASLIRALDAELPDGQQSNLQMIYANHWKTICGMTHAGAEHFGMWSEGHVLEPAYTEDDIGRILDFAARLGILAVAGLATLSDQPGLSGEVLKESEQFRPPRYESEPLDAAAKETPPDA